MTDERAETLKREFKVKLPNHPAASGEEEPSAEPAPAEEAPSEESAEESVETDESVSEDEKTPEEAKEEKPIMIPKARFDEVNRALKEARAKLKEQEAEKSGEEPQLDQDAIKVLEDFYSKKSEPIKKRLDEISIKLEVDQAMKEFPDFKDNPELVKAAIEKVKENPNYSLSDAYKIVSYDLKASSSREQGKEEAYKNIEGKKAARGESGGKRFPQKSVEELLADKSVPLSEIEKLLPKA